MAISARFPGLWHGGDYNPDQWPDETQVEDVRLMKLAHCNAMSVAVFSWAQLEPREGMYEWGWLDRTFERLGKAGVAIALATPSATPPRWLTARHPEIVSTDAHGVRGRAGGRQRFCPTAGAYREHVARINRAMAERYGKEPALALWHISNEYVPTCWCETCVEAFRGWLEARYGDLETLNQQWWGSFWSQRYSDWSEVFPPYVNAAVWGWTGLNLDWKRFQSHAVCEFLKFEVGTVRPITPDVPVTTNMMGQYYELDYAKLADVVDVISWDSYPVVTGGVPEAGNVAFTHALMRGMKGQRPWLLIEQTPSATNWQANATLKPPGFMRLWSWQAMGHGSDGAMYFQWRRSRGSAEKFHGAVVEHAGTEHARVFQEVAALGAEMEKVSGEVVGTTVARARVGILWDQECRWGLHFAGGFAKDKNYAATLVKHYRALWGQNIAVDVVRMDADWGQYDVLLAPVMYMVKSGAFPRRGSAEDMRTKLDEAGKIEAFVRRGGTFVTTYLSGLVNENDLVHEGGYPGPLRKLLGLWAEEIDCTEAGKFANTMVLGNGALEVMEESYGCDRYFDLIHPEGCEVLATYGGNWYAGRACLTRRRVGEGWAYYIATDAADAFLRDFYAAVAGEKGIEAVADGVEGVEVVERVGEGKRLVFIMNHRAEPAEVSLDVGGVDLLTGERLSPPTVQVAGYGVRIMKVDG